MRKNIIVDIESFILFHKNRISLLKEFAKNKSHGKLIFQISFLGFESLARLLYPKENDSSKRFIDLLSLPNMGVDRNTATELYGFWRNSLTHQGFIAYPWTTLEAWSEYDIPFLSYPENKLRTSTEFPPESMIAIYESRIEYLEDFFKKTEAKKLEFYP
ncbi:MAG: hypothetical protein AABW79_04805 [Nanoarchaeota archaeon]